MAKETKGSTSRWIKFIAFAQVIILACIGWMTIRYESAMRQFQDNSKEYQQVATEHHAMLEEYKKAMRAWNADNNVR